ncbi:MAG: hypothetical protein R3B95_19595 [Nitrospirales bacterium]|nr:hypothetical protein [Nitrospirales bacterium]
MPARLELINSKMLLARLEELAKRMPNKGLRPTAYSVRCATASGSGGNQELGATDHWCWHMFRLRFSERESRRWSSRYFYPHDGEIEDRIAPTARERGCLRRTKFLKLCRRYASEPV